MNKKEVFRVLIALCGWTNLSAQLDSVVVNMADTLISKLIVEDIPRKSFHDKLMYPHRWYVKQLLRPKITDFDSTYITSNKRRLTLTLPISKKFFGFNLTDPLSNKTLQFSPNTYYNVGFNFSNIILTFGFAPGLRFGAKPGHGNTSSRDYQLTLIGRRVITDLNFQNYKGFYVYNARDYALQSQNPEEVEIRPDIRVLSFGVNTMFIYNYKKYSLRGAFSFTDVQRKSAGSFMTGVYHSHVIFSSTDTSIVKAPFRPYFSETLQEVNSISVISLGVSLGYGYTFVYRKMILSSVVNLGGGGQKTNYTTLNNQGYSLGFNASVHLNAKASLRYDNMRFFGGLMATYDDNRIFNEQFFNTSNYISRITFFTGYRFNLKQNGRKILKFLGLSDYEK